MCAEVDPASGTKRTAPGRFVFLGPPGSGKGTAAEWVSKRLSVPHVSTGAIFRQEISLRHPLGKEVEDCVSQGRLVSDDVVMKVIDRWFREQGARGFVFDGFPRTVPQARLFEGLLARYGAKLDGVVYMDVSRAEMEERICGRVVCRMCGANFHLRRKPPLRKGICDACGGELARREDDSLGTLRQRWSVFETQTADLAAFYDARDLLRRVHASGLPEEMCRRVWEALFT